MVKLVIFSIGGLLSFFFILAQNPPKGKKNPAQPAVVLGQLPVGYEKEEI